MKDNTVFAILGSVLIVTVGSCQMHETHVKSGRSSTPTIVTNTIVTNIVTEPSAISTIALAAAVRNSETTAQLVALNGTIVDRVIALHKRVAELEARLDSPPKTVLEGYTNIYISPDLITTNILKWYTNLHETH